MTLSRVLCSVFGFVLAIHNIILLRVYVYEWGRTMNVVGMERSTEILYSNNHCGLQFASNVLLCGCSVFALRLVGVTIADDEYSSFFEKPSSRPIYLTYPESVLLSFSASYNIRRSRTPPLAVPKNPTYPVVVGQVPASSDLTYRVFIMWVLTQNNQPPFSVLLWTYP